MGSEHSTDYSSENENENTSIDIEDEINCLDSEDGEIYKVKKKDLLNKINITLEECFETTKEEEIIINDFPCKIKFINGYYCGYVLIDKINKSEYCDKKINILINSHGCDLSSLIGFAAHGGYSSYFGFDCSHPGDLSIINRTDDIYIGSFKSDEKSFKTRSYVIDQLEKMTMGIKIYLEL